MWNPKKIYIENLFAHKESSYVFKKNDCTVIFGKNLTDKGFDNNGGGKTTLFEAISLALTNESLRSIKRDSFINKEEEFCKISLELENPVLKSNLIISRTFFRKKPVKVEIIENGKINKQIVSVNEANKRITELIGISKEDLLRYYIISQDNNYNFFTASDVEKKEIMNRITSADMILPVFEEIEEKLTENNRLFNEINSNVVKYTGKLETLEEQREELLNKSNDSLNRIENRNKNIKRKQEENISLKKEINSLKLSVEKKENELSNLKKIDSSKMKKERKILISKKNEIQEEIFSNKKMKRDIKLDLSGKIKCPNCKTEFIKDSKLKLSVEECNLYLETIESEIINQNNKLEEIELKIDKKQKDIKKQNDIEDLRDSLTDNINKLNRKIKQKRENEIENKKDIVELKQEIEKIRKESDNDSIVNRVIEKINKCNDSLKIFKNKLIPIQEEIDMLNFWKFNFGKNGFTTYLANKSIKIIEGSTNLFLKKFKVDVSVLINGFKILKNGDVREKIDIFVSNDGITSELFLSKSGGERGRVVLAGILAIQKLINLSTNGRGLNLICFDECFHGVDSRGQENIVKIFEKMGITILVITQNISDSFNNENNLYVVKEKGISRYVNKEEFDGK